MNSSDVFPVRLRELRERRRISRRTLAELIGLSHGAISRFERGEREPRLGDVIALAEFFEVSVDYLVGRDN